jgi:hypothetical protein
MAVTVDVARITGEVNVRSETRIHRQFTPSAKIDDADITTFAICKATDETAVGGIFLIDNFPLCELNGTGMVDLAHQPASFGNVAQIQLYVTRADPDEAADGSVFVEIQDLLGGLVRIRLTDGDCVLISRHGRLPVYPTSLIRLTFESGTNCAVEFELVGHRDYDAAPLS